MLHDRVGIWYTQIYLTLLFFKVLVQIQASTSRLPAVPKTFTCSLFHFLCVIVYKLAILSEVQPYHAVVSISISWVNDEAKKWFNMFSDLLGCLKNLPLWIAYSNIFLIFFCCCCWSVFLLNFFLCLLDVFQKYLSRDIWQCH